MFIKSLFGHFMSIIIKIMIITHSSICCVWCTGFWLCNLRNKNFHNDVLFVDDEALCWLSYWGSTLSSVVNLKMCFFILLYMLHIFIFLSKHFSIMFTFVFLLNCVSSLWYFFFTVMHMNKSWKNKQAKWLSYCYMKNHCGNSCVKKMIILCWYLLIILVHFWFWCPVNYQKL